VLLSTHAKRKNRQVERKRAPAQRGCDADHGFTTQQETTVNQSASFTAARRLAALFSAVMITACGGSDDPPTQAPTPAPAPAPAGPDTAFATPLNATDTAEAGKIDTYAYAEKSNELTPGTPSFAAGAVNHSATLTGAQAYAGAAVRYHAPNNTGSAPVTTFDASAFSKLKIQLRSSSDALLLIKLHPATVAADGCTATASAVVSSTLTELVIDLNTASFPLPDYCNGAGSGIAAVKAGLYAVDVINTAVNAGTHHVGVGTVKLAP
jgi:hypothetical protein